MSHVHAFLCQAQVHDTLQTVGNSNKSTVYNEHLQAHVIA